MTAIWPNNAVTFEPVDLPEMERCALGVDFAAEEGDRQVTVVCGLGVDGKVYALAEGEIPGAHDDLVDASEWAYRRVVEP